MKRLLLFLTIVAFCTNISKADIAELKCNINENKCTQVDVQNGKEIKREYIGNIKNGKPEGKGILRAFISGKTYFAKGTFITVENNTIKLTDGTVNLGDLEIFKKKDKIYKIIHKNGDILEGFFDEKTLFLKKGSQTFKNGERFVGEWDEKGFYKEGTYTFSNGLKFSGTFQNGNIKNGLMSELTGNSFSGSFNNKKQRVEGVYRIKDGTRYEGSFFQDNIGNYKNGTYYYKNGGRTVFTEGKDQYYPPERKTNIEQTYKSSTDSDWDFIEILKYPLWALGLFLVYYFLKDIVVAIMKTSIGGIVKFYGMMFFIITTLVLFAFFLKMILGG